MNVPKNGDDGRARSGSDTRPWSGRPRSASTAIAPAISAAIVSSSAIRVTGSSTWSLNSRAMLATVMPAKLTPTR